MPTDRSNARPHRAFDAALGGATLDGIRDVLEALQSGWFATRSTKVELVHRTWGTAGTGTRAETLSACPLNALFISQANQQGSGLAGAAALAERAMGRRGYRAADFYVAWDLEALDVRDLRELAEAHLDAQLNVRR